MKIKITLLIISLNFILFYGISQNVSLYAGFPWQSGYSPVHQPKLKFYFNQPYGLAFDSKGNLWVSNFAGNTVAVICASDGMVYSKAGDNTNGFRNGVASVAVFSSPSGLSVGPGDTVYVADADNCVIRRIYPMLSCASNLTVDVKAGKYSYNLYMDHKYQSYPGFANGASNVAQFNNPMDVTVDNLGNIYVADAGNHCIRKITKAGMVSTFAGQCTKAGYKDTIASQALFNYPVAVLVGPAPNYDLYVADHDNMQIRKISGNQVTTVNTSDSIWTSMGLAFKNTDTLFISDNQSILESLTSGTSTYAGPDRDWMNDTGYVNAFGMAARFHDVHDLVFDPSNKNIFYVADMNNQVIRKIINCASYTPVVTATQTTFCKGDSGTLTVQGTYSAYNWSTGAKTKSIVVKNSGSYTCTVTDANSCPGTSSPVVVTTTDLQPTVTPDGPLSFCSGDSVMLVAEAGLSYYKWYKGSTIIKQGTQGLAQTLTVKTSGSYYLQGTEKLCTGNSGTFTVNVGSNVVPLINITGDTNLCTGDSVIFSTSTPFTSYVWKNGTTTLSTNRQLIVTTAGTYTVSVTQSTGCKGSSVPIKVTLFPAAIKPTISVNDTILTSSSAVFYQWYKNGVIITGATSQVYHAARNAKYQVLITNSNGCKALSNSVNIGKTSISDQVAESWFTIYPNPVNDELNISFKNEKPVKVKIIITDILGKIVLNKTEQSANNSNFTYNIKSLNKGIYLVTVFIGNESGTSKLIKE